MPAQVLTDREASLQARQKALQTEIREFRSQLMGLWVDAGKPDPNVLAQRTQVPASVFAMFLSDRAMPLPEQREVIALLDGLLWMPDRKRELLLDRLAVLERHRHELDADRVQFNRQLRGLPPTPPAAAAQPEAEALTSSGPLIAALKATTREEFQRALGQLRAAAGLSYGQLAKRANMVPGSDSISRSTAHRVETGDRMPERGPVTAFARACGASQGDVRLWGQARDALVSLLASGGKPDEVRGRLEVVEHPVSYPLGRPGADETVLRELRVRVTPQLKTVSTASAAAAGITAAAMASPNLRTKSLLFGIAAGLGCATLGILLRNKISKLDDDQLTALAGWLSTMIPADSRNGWADWQR